MLVTLAERQRREVASPRPRRVRRANPALTAIRLVVIHPDRQSLSIQTASLRAFLHDAKETLNTLQRVPTPHPTTNAILREVQAVHEAVNGLATPPASQPTSPRPARAQISSALAPTPPRSPTPPSKGPELTLDISGPKERRNAQSLSNEAIIQKICNKNGPAEKQW
ncbi:Hypothetical protein D9617_73g062140 [Elsinoe fawcettii]|nr:Hypothetical protein D9617_73g062140 [Elsinoe fawcettii]